MNNKIKKFAYLTLFVSILIVMSIVPFLGYVPLGIINATTLHIPVILGSILLGKKEGMILGFIFGLTSLIKATFEPNATSFLFSPFFSFGNINGNFASLIIAFGPRILLGYFSNVVYNLIKDKNENIAVILGTFIGSMTNTILVLSLAYIFFKDAYASALGIGSNMVLGFIMSIVFTNGITEALLAVIVILAIYKATNKTFKRWR